MTWEPSTTSIPDDIYRRCERCGWQKKDFVKLAELHRKRQDGQLPFLHLLAFVIDGMEYVIVDCSRDDGTGWRGVDFGPVLGATARFAPNSIMSVTGQHPTVIYTDNPRHASDRWGQTPSSTIINETRPDLLSKDQVSAIPKYSLFESAQVQSGECVTEVLQTTSHLASEIASPPIDTGQSIKTCSDGQVHEAQLVPLQSATSALFQLGRGASELLLEFNRLTATGDRPHNWVARSMALSEPATDAVQFGSWIRNVRLMTVDTLNRLPATESDVFDAIRIFDDCLHGNRLPQYEIEVQWLSKNEIHIQRLRDLSESTVERLQRSLLQLLVTEIQRSLDDKEQMGDRSHWTTTLRMNVWKEPLQNRIREAVAMFAEKHEAAVWPQTGDSVFSEEVKSRFISDWHEIAKPCSRKNWHQVWGELFEFAKLIVTLTTEGKSDAELARLRGSLQERMSVFDILWLMRHRDAHGTAYSHLSNELKRKIHLEWVSVQRWIAKRIGRRWAWSVENQPRSSFYDEDRDLHLTAFEGSHAKLELLLAASTALGSLNRPE